MSLLLQLHIARLYIACFVRQFQGTILATNHRKVLNKNIIYFLKTVTTNSRENL